MTFAFNNKISQGNVLLQTMHTVLTCPEMYCKDPKSNPKSDSAQDIFSCSVGLIIYPEKCAASLLMFHCVIETLY